MAGLGGLASGFQAGFGMMDRHYQNQANQKHRQWQRERAEQQDAQRAELHDLKVGEHERQQQLRGLNALRHQASQADGPMEIDFNENEWARDPVFQQFRERTKVDPSKLLGENRKPTEQAVQYFEQLASGQDNRRPIEVMNDERTLSSAQVLLGELVNENLGETFERDGKTYTIRDKRISSVVPDQTGEGVHIGLKVEAVGPDGEPYEYEAPMTEGHSANDDLVLDVPIDKIMQRVQGHKALLQGTANMSPEEVRAALEPEILRLGGELPQQENFEVLRDEQGNPIAQMGPDGRMHDLPQSMRPGGGDDADWRRLNDGSLFNQRTGEVRQAGPGGGGGVGAPGTEAPSSVWAQMRSDYSNRYGLDAEQMMVMLQTHGEEAVNQYMEERAGPNVPNLMDFARQEYGVDPATGTFVRDMRPQFQGQQGGGMPQQGGQPMPGGMPQQGQAPAGGMPQQPMRGGAQQQSPGQAQAGGLRMFPPGQSAGFRTPEGERASLIPDGGPGLRARAGDPAGDRQQAPEPAGFGQREDGTPGWVREGAVERNAFRGGDVNQAMPRRVRRAAPFFEKIEQGVPPERGELHEAIEAAEAGLLTPEAEQEVRRHAREYANRMRNQGQ
ncbi:hypothetical protein [Thioalkalivibrio sp. ALE12]|uniref:hypothetical protein n=1 Tax=Thioalkalivibrio sp. ALE12 TaxID=1158170 RepID=UPI00037D5AD4|nr:hypothetical protein [Thioalkalivibrio sp. ALE12]